jgi:serine protease Do
VRRAVLGIAICDVDPDDAGAAGLKTIEGVKVGGFTPSDGTSPAQKAGLDAGDIIVGADGKPVDRVSTLQRIVRMHQPGQSLALDIMRFGTRKTFSVKLTEAPGEEQVARRDAESNASPGSISIEKLGISGEPISLDVARQASIPDADRGLRITDVAGSGPAHNKLSQNDIIVAVLFPEPRKEVHSVADLQGALSQLKTGDYVSLLIYHVQPQLQGQGQGQGQGGGGQAQPGTGQQSGLTTVVSLRIGGDGRD